MPKIFAAALLIPLLLLQTRVCFAETNNDAVERAIVRAKEYLYEAQKNGNWEVTNTPVMDDTEKDENGKIVRKSGQDVDGAQYGGRTALAVYALLAAGESPQSEKLKPAIEFLKKTPMRGTYALGMRLQAWLFMPESPEIRKLATNDAKQLLSMMHTQGDIKGFYDYTKAKPGGAYSLSRAQYAVLGMWAAEQMGVEIQSQFWSIVEGAWVKHQDASGAWKYREGSNREYPFTVGITAVGVATLFITQDYLHSSRWTDCRGNVSNAAIDKGMKWIGEHYERYATDEKFDREYTYPVMYAMERIGVASGYKYISNEDWFKKGSKFLLKEQRKNGSWYGGAKFIGDIPDTCFALLFLARGRAPVVMNKLDYSNETEKRPWNQRPRDAANISGWIGHWLERDLNWQIVNLNVDVNELHDAPILYIAGSQKLELTPEQGAKIKQFIEQGGLVLGHADCGAAAFNDSFNKLAAEWFPKYEMRALPDSHPIYTNQQFRREKMRAKPALAGVSNGARELMILIDKGDLARAWQIRAWSTREETFQTGANIFQYAIDKQNLRYKGDSYIVSRDSEDEPRKSITLARLQHDGNWDPEPGGWRRMQNVMHNAGTKLQIEVVDPSKLAIGAQVAHLTGTGTIILSETTRNNLKAFVAGGGTLLVDSCGGSPDFAAAMDAELRKTFSAEFTNVGADNEIWKSIEMPAIEWRSFAIKNGAGGGSQIKGIEVDGRLAVLFSPYDLSAGLVGQPVDGIIGYSPATATGIVQAILSSTAK